jgi:hypothetical protein
MSVERKAGITSSWQMPEVPVVNQVSTEPNATQDLDLLQVHL